MLTRLFRPMPCGSLFGIPILVVPAVFLLIAVVVLSADQNAHGVMAALAILGVGLLLHEMGHALVARRLGLRVLDITIWPLGGMARMEGLSGHPRQEAMVAASGPAVNLVLALLALPFPGTFASLVVGINLVLGLGNLIPAFPLDGGRLLRAWLARRSSMVDATFAAVRLAKFLALAVLALGLWSDSFWIGLILAIYIWWSGQVEFLQVMMAEGRQPELAPREVWRRACYPLFGGPEPPVVPHGPTEAQPTDPPEDADTSIEELEEFRGSMDEFFRNRKPK